MVGLVRVRVDLTYHHNMVITKGLHLQTNNNPSSHRDKSPFICDHTNPHYSVVEKLNERTESFPGLFLIVPYVCVHVCVYVYVRVDVCMCVSLVTLFTLFHN